MYRVVSRSHGVQKVDADSYKNPSQGQIDFFKGGTRIATFCEVVSVQLIEPSPCYSPQIDHSKVEHAHLDEMSMLSIRSYVHALESLDEERTQLLNALPKCPVHDSCVPYALEWIEEQKNLPSDRGLELWIAPQHFANLRTMLEREIPYFSTIGFNLPAALLERLDTYEGGM